MYKWVWVLAFVFFLLQALLSYRQSLYLSGDNFYPVKAVGYLSKNIPQGEIFSGYGWGGYLIQNLQEKRVFIDGRMPSWRWKSAPEGELASAFDTYIEITEGEIDYKETFDEYNIEIVLWGKSRQEGGLEVWSHFSNCNAIAAHDFSTGVFAGKVGCLQLSPGHIVNLLETTRL